MYQQRMTHKNHRRQRIFLLISIAFLVVFMALWWFFTAQPITGPTTFSRYGYRSSSNAALPGAGNMAAADWTFAAQRPLLLSSEAGGQIFSVSIGDTWPQYQHGTVYALSAKSGKLLWKTALNNWVMTAPLVADGLVFVGSGNQQWTPQENQKSLSLNTTNLVRGIGPNAIYALNEKTGKVVWKVATRGEDMPTFVYQNGVVYVANGAGNVLALSAKTGKILWKTHIVSYVSMASPVIVGNELVVGGAHPYAVYGLSLKTGKILWHHDLTQAVGGTDDCSLAAGDGLVYTAATAGSWNSPETQFYALTPQGKQVWEHTVKPPKVGDALPSNIEIGAPVYADGSVYVGSPISEEELALNAKTGTVEWHAAMPAPVASSDLVAHGTVLALTQAGQVVAIDQKTGKIL
ncbi:MAG: PQQ-binding-like beta-propeller repeat protein, partial [Firmicutes bacterium]|nr:PQQ-binding-like beta-propeller repeat protein [Bacillota bacterium]